MKTTITTAIAAMMLTFACNNTMFANTNTDVRGHKPVHHTTVRKVVPTPRCHCHTCNDLLRHRHDAHFAMHAKATHRCDCPACRDIHHNEAVMHRHHADHSPMAYAPAPKPAPRPTPTPNRTGDKAVPGRR